jgi:hypothetical protein
MLDFLERTTLRWYGARLVCAVLLCAAGPAFTQVSQAGGDTTKNQVSQAGTDTTKKAALKSTGAAAVADLRVDSVSPRNGLLGHGIVVRLQNLDALAAEGRIVPDSLVLFLNGRAIADAAARRVGPNELEFALAYTGPSSQVWLATLDGLRASVGRRSGPVRVSVGYPRGLEAPPARASAPVMLNFRPYSEFRLRTTQLGLLIALGLFIWLVLRSDVLRDSMDGSDLEMHERPYSLGRTQAAAWFFAVFASFLYIRLVTLNYNSLNAEALFLLGLGLATQAGAGLVDTSRRTKARAAAAELGPKVAEMKEQVKEMTVQEEQLAASTDPVAKMQLHATRSATGVKLADAEREVSAANALIRGSRSDNFFLDLVSDGEGVSLHRFQMVAWTAVLIGIYLTEVYSKLALPAFSATLMGLMGLSSTAYVGLKPTERQPAATESPAKPDATNEPADALRGATIPTMGVRGIVGEKAPV